METIRDAHWLNRCRTAIVSAWIDEMDSDASGPECQDNGHVLSEWTILKGAADGLNARRNCSR